MATTMKVKLLTNVMFGGEHHMEGVEIEVSSEIAKQLISQSLGEAVGKPAPDGKEQTKNSPDSSGKTAKG